MKKYEVNVAVATLWTKNDSARPIDEQGVSNPVNLNKWLEQLPYKERLAVCDDNLVQSQLLYGEELLVLEEKDNWSFVIATNQPSRKDERGYPGWVATKQIQEKKQRDEGGKYVIVTANKAQLFHEDFSPGLVVSFNTLLDYVEENNTFYVVDTPHGSARILKSEAAITQSPIHGNNQSMAEAMQHALQFLDVPYLWGGMSSYGYDCSGFTYNIAKSAGHIIGRDATEQSLGGKEVPIDDRSQWKEGDLIFFADAGETESVRHVGIYFGNDLLFHSHQTGKSVELYKLAGSKLESEICAVRRYD